RRARDEAGAADTPDQSAPPAQPAPESAAARPRS
ncbi:hypothetical protein GA0115240_111219, partial [Streptomyces sp. DvalAA-14]